jgi:hypothetical protein
MNINQELEERLLEYSAGIIRLHRLAAGRAV